MMRLSAMWSMVDCSERNVASAAFASPLAIAFWIFLMALRSVVRMLWLAARCLTLVFARLAACLVLAMGCALFSVSEMRGEACYDTRLVHTKQSPRLNLLRAAASVSGMTLASRITGFIRDTLFAVLFGAGFAMDVFAVAFRLPNLLRRLFAEGAFSQAFVPVLGEYRGRKGDEATRELAGKVLAVLAVVLFIATVIGVLAAPAIVYLSASGFAKDPEKFQLTVTMLRICFPYILFVSLVSFCAGLLNTYGAFKAPAFTPVLLNLSSIAFMLWVAPHMEKPIVALAWAVFFGGLAQLLFQVPFLRRIGMWPRPRWAPHDDGVMRIVKLMAPAALRVSVAPVSLLLNTPIGS